MNLSIAELLELTSIIEESGLSKADKCFRPGSTNLDRLSRLLSVIDRGHRPFVLELVKHYDIINQYAEPLYNILNSLSALHTEEVILFPLTEIGPRGAIKSGSHVFYEMKGIANTEFVGRFRCLDAPDSNDVLRSPLPKYAVDDFIGSGDQFLDMIEKMREINDQVFLEGVATIAILESGKRSIESRSMRVVCQTVKRKGIDGYLRDNGGDPALLYSLYDAIEAGLQVGPRYTRGYQASEALISMKNTPDNTLPIFWHRGGHKQWPAPFPR